MSDLKLTDLIFTLTWESPFAKHTEVYHLYQVDPLNDEFPLELGTQVAALSVGKSCTETFHSKEVIGEEFSAEKVKHLDSELFNTNFKGKSSLPSLYRFYPKAIAYEGLETTEQDYSACRLISITEDELVIDNNHPLAKYYLTITTTKVREYGSNKNKRKRKNIGKLITSKGPGMQLPFEFGDSVFFDEYPYKIKKETNLSTPHLDANAIQQIKAFYSEKIPEYSKVLDLLTDQKTYLEDDFQTGLLVGINQDEGILVSNEKLDTYDVQDINNDVILPYDANYFDVVICTLSIEYLADPLELMHEISRVVKAGGRLIITFSNNPSRSDSMELWDELHPFERMQLVLEFFRNTELFKDLNTYSNRGVLRPKEDPYYGVKRFSDPVFAVLGDTI